VGFATVVTTFEEYLTELYSREGHQGRVGPDTLEGTVDLSLFV
jgi:hypothetical protein